MEEKNLTPNESIRIISQMIEASKHRVAMPDTRISVMWAALSVITAGIVLACCLITGNPSFNLIWFAIPLIGIPLNIRMAKNTTAKRGAKNYIDRISDGIWSVVGYIGIGLTIICLLFSFFGYNSIWLSMFFYAFIIVGFGAAMQGIVIREKSYVIGGLISILTGFIMIVCVLAGIRLLLIWTIPAYMICFIVMFLVPAIIIRKKLNKANR